MRMMSVGERRHYLPTMLLVFALMTTSVVVVGGSGQKLRMVEVTAAEEAIRDAAGFAAIRELHREMDDDHSGSIDRAETAGFMTEDMNMRGSADRQSRESAFHGDDDAISVDDLWVAWFESEERAWSAEQVRDWLEHVVGLPQYGEVVLQKKIDGIILPRLAVHNSSYMSSVLGVKSSVHRQKLRLYALDVVLFGYRNPRSYVKDIVLALLLVVLSVFAIFHFRHRQKAAKDSAELSAKVSQLQTMEAELADSQRLFEEERKRQDATRDDTSDANQELVANLRAQLQAAQRRLEEVSAGGAGGAPLALQPLLRRTCEHELAEIERHRSDCVHAMREAIDMVEKLKKKQSSFVNSLKLTTGASGGTEQVDSRIFTLRSRMEKIHKSAADAQRRWLQIESLCGFSILYSSETILAAVSAKTSMQNNNHQAPVSVAQTSTSTSSTSSSSASVSVAPLTRIRSTGAVTDERPSGMTVVPDTTHVSRQVRIASDSAISMANESCPPSLTDSVGGGPKSRPSSPPPPLLKSSTNASLLNGSVRSTEPQQQNGGEQRSRRDDSPSLSPSDPKNKQRRLLGLFKRQDTNKTF